MRLSITLLAGVCALSSCTSKNSSDRRQRIAAGEQEGAGDALGLVIKKDCASGTELQLVRVSFELGDQDILKYRDGMVTAFLPYRPVRLENLTAIALGRHLIRDGDGWFCQFDADEMKDKQSLSFTFPDRLVPYLQTYLNIYRPILLKGNNFPELWISTRGTPMSEQSVYWNTCRLTEELFGQRINPHLFRDCAASAMATDDPEHVLAIARILGHSSIETSTRHYNQSQMTAAGDILHEVLADLSNVPDTGDHRSDV